MLAASILLLFSLWQNTLFLLLLSSTHVINMKKIYIPLLRKKSFYFFFQVFFAALIFNISSTGVLAQGTPADFTAISWDTGAGQLYSTHEVHGEVVNGKLYIFGGYNINKLPKFTPTKRASVYDPTVNTWTSIANLPHTPNGSGFGGITHEGLTTDGTDIFLAGGYTSNANGTGQIFGTKQVWRYNVASNTYTSLPDLPEALAAGQLKYLNGKIHYIGGANLLRADVAVHYALDLNNLAAGWKALAPPVNPRNHPGSAVYGGKIYFIGGSHQQDEAAIAQKTLEAYDESTNTWTRLADMPVGRDHISSSVVVMGDRILVLGGETSHNVESKLVSAYSPATNTWTELTPLPANRAAGVAAVLNGNIYYTGGNFSKINYKGTPSVVLSSQAPSTTTSPVSASGENTFNPERNLKKPIIYPNPIRKQFKIRFPDTYKGYFSFTIVDQTGKVYNLGKRRVQRGASDIAIDISNLSLRSGVYFLKINSETKNEELKLIIQ
jgi:N-acetylneuraminic acid mutarotase